MTMHTADTLQPLVDEVTKFLNRDSVDPDESLAVIGIDSLNVVELILICNALYPNVTNPELITFNEHSTLREIDLRMRDLSLAA